jgi:hypothetical protein
VPDELAEAFRERADAARRPNNEKDKGYTTVLEAALRAYLEKTVGFSPGENPEERNWLDAFRGLTPARRRIGLVLLAALRRDQDKPPDAGSGLNTRNRSK